MKELFWNKQDLFWLSARTLITIALVLLYQLTNPSLVESVLLFVFLTLVFIF